MTHGDRGRNTRGEISACCGVGLALVYFRQFPRGGALRPFGKLRQPDFSGAPRVSSVSKDGLPNILWYYSEMRDNPGGLRHSPGHQLII